MTKLNVEVQDEEYLKDLFLDLTDPEDQVMNSFFTPTRILGHGAFSTVISAYDKLSECPVAIKILSKSSFKKSQVEMLRRESTILNKLNHPNIVRMKMTKETLGKIYLVMEEVQGSSLEDYMTDRKDKDDPLKEYEIKDIIIQVVKAMKYFHEKNIIHRDLKPQNILVQELSVNDTNYEKQFKVKIIDFGLSIQMESQNSQPLNDNCGTLLYMAPEAALKKDYNRSVDIWSLGIVIFMMYTMGKHPFWEQGEDTKKSYLEKLKNPLWTFWPDNIDKKACNFLTKTATRRQDCRMTAHQCQRHPWLLGEGEITDPITMNDMITTFSAMQGFSRLTKGILVLYHLIQKMNSVGSVYTKTILVQKQEIQKVIQEDLKTQNLSSDNDSQGSRIRGLSNKSNSDHEESYKKGQQISQHTKSNNFRHTEDMNSSYMQPVKKRNQFKPTDQTNSAGMMSRKTSAKLLVFKPNQKYKNSFEFEGSIKKDLTLTFKNPVQPTFYSTLSRTPSHPINMYQSIQIQSNKKESINSTKTQYAKIFEQQMNNSNGSLKLPILAQKPPVGRKSIQFLKDDITSSTSNSPGSNSNKNSARDIIRTKSFFAKQL